MNTETKEAYVQPVLVKHELLRDITANGSRQDQDFLKQWWRLGG